MDKWIIGALPSIWFCAILLIAHKTIVPCPLPLDLKNKNAVTQNFKYQNNKYPDYQKNGKMPKKIC